MQKNTFDTYRAEELRLVSQRLFNYDINRTTVNEFPVDFLSQLMVLQGLEKTLRGV